VIDAQELKQAFSALDKDLNEKEVTDIINRWKAENTDGIDLESFTKE